MSENIPHNYQWSQTESVIKEFCYLLKHYRNNKQKLQEIFLDNLVFATEKLDGTNVAKDISGQRYGRRMLISGAKSDYQKTPLSQVDAVNIQEMKNKICMHANIDERDVDNFIVYGELICNHFYGYDVKVRNLHGKWAIFGARIISKNSGILEKF